MNYKIIHDKDQMLQFIDWLPDLKEHEKFYGCLFGRKKYCPELITHQKDKAQIVRFITTKERMFEKIQQLEVPKGGYKFKGIDVPQEALVLYVNPSPRNMLKATWKVVHKILESLEQGDISVQAHNKAVSVIQNTKSYTYASHFDLDQKPFDFNNLFQFVNREAVKIIETRGGYHFLIDSKKVNKEFRNTWYKNIESLGCDKAGDQLLPVPGGYQGGFIPKFINI